MTAPLLPSETVLWRGRPGSYPVFDRSDFVTLPFGVVFLGVLGYFFVWPAWRDHSAFGIVATTIFSAAALYNVVGRLVVRQLTLRSAEYVVTDQRLVVRSKLFGHAREQAVWLTKIEPPVLTESADGTGSITFGDTRLFDRYSSRGDGSNRDEQPPEFVGIPDARRVRDLVASARQKAMES
jgi:hypothetical protein